MPKPLLRKTPLTVLLIVLALGAVGQSEPADTVKHFYYTLVPGTGAGVQWCSRTDGLMSISLPYSTTDASGQTTNATFRSTPKKIYWPVKVTVLPFMMEVGSVRHAFNFGISFPIADAFTGGAWITAGYGFNWYLSGWRHHRSNPVRKAFVIKATLNVLYDWDLGLGDAGTLGVIDNTGKVIHVLDHTADSIFTHKRYRSSETDTYNAKNCTLHYAQRELALMPRVILSNSPFVHRAQCELILGYTLPLIDRGGIYIEQDDGNKASKVISHPLNITHSGLTVVYNNAVIRKTPYRFGGFYLGCAFSIGRGWRERKNP